MSKRDPLDDSLRIRALEEVVKGYAEHQSWRCQYRSRYDECCCGLDAAMAALGFDPVPVNDPEASLVEPDPDSDRDWQRDTAAMDPP